MALYAVLKSKYFKLQRQLGAADNSTGVPRDHPILADIRLGLQVAVSQLRRYEAKAAEALELLEPSATATRLPCI